MLVNMWRKVRGRSRSGRRDAEVLVEVPVAGARAGCLSSRQEGEKPQRVVVAVQDRPKGVCFQDQGSSRGHGTKPAFFEFSEKVRFWKGRCPSRRRARGSPRTGAPPPPGEWPGEVPEAGSPFRAGSPMQRGNLRCGKKKKKRMAKAEVERERFPQRDGGR